MLTATLLYVWFILQQDGHPLAGEGTAIGQGILFLTFLINIGVQVWRERNTRKDAEEAKLDALKREQRIKDALKEQTKEIAKQADARVNSLRKRLNGLLEPENGNDA